MAGIIYYITSASTGRIYVGSTTRTVKQRKSEHLHYLRKGTHHSPHLQRVYDKYGEADLSVTAVYECEPGEDVLAVEQAHINGLRGSTMNAAPVSYSIYAAHAANRGRKMPEEERQRRSESAKLSIAEGRAKRGPWSAERKAAHGERLKGRKMPPVSAETRKNIGQALRLRSALLGNSPKVKGPDRRTAFIEAEIDSWLAMHLEGKSFRKIEELTGRSRDVISRECKKRLSSPNEQG